MQSELPEQIVPGPQRLDNGRNIDSISWTTDNAQRGMPHTHYTVTYRHACRHCSAAIYSTCSTSALQKYNVRLFATCVIGARAVLKLVVQCSTAYNEGIEEVFTEAGLQSDSRISFEGFVKIMRSATESPKQPVHKEGSQPDELALSTPTALAAEVVVATPATATATAAATAATVVVREVKHAQVEQAVIVPQNNSNTGSSSSGSSTTSRNSSDSSSNSDGVQYEAAALALAVTIGAEHAHNTDVCVS
eukprot:7266-Heterococcus_DN1.PRE.1